MYAILKRAMQVDDAQLGAFLLESGLLSRRDLQDIETHRTTTGVSLQKAVTQSGLLSQDEFRRALGAFLGIPFLVLDVHAIPIDVLTTIPEPFARAHHLIAFARSGQTVEIATLEPSLPPLPFLSSQLRVLVRLTDADSMKRALLRYQKHIKETTGDYIARQVQHIPSGPIADIAQAAERLAVAEVVDLVLKHALLCHASDVHIQLTSEKCTIRYRIHGVLCDAFLLPLHVGMHVSARLKQLAKLSVHTKLPQYGQCKVEGDVHARLTIASTPTLLGEQLVVHIIPHTASRGGFTLEALGFHGQSLDRVHRALQHRSGLLLVSGPAGAGKTTTLYTLLDGLISPEKQIVTVEQERSIMIPAVVQLERTPDISLTNTLRAALRHDPDVLMIDAIADEEVATLACAAANRGVLVLAGIEAYSAGEGAALLQSLVPTLPLAPILIGSLGVSQVRKLCDKRETYRLARAQTEQIESIADPVRVLNALKKEGMVEKNVSWKELLFPHAVSCAQCDAGYKGRIGLQEVFLVSRALQGALENHADALTIERIAWEEGMLTIPEDGIYKTVTGLTTLAEVVRVTQGE